MMTGWQGLLRNSCAAMMGLVLLRQARVRWMAHSVVGRRRWCFAIDGRSFDSGSFSCAAANLAEACQRGQILEAVVEMHGDATPPSRLALVPIRSCLDPGFLFLFLLSLLTSDARMQQRHPMCLSIDLPTTTPVLFHIHMPLPDCYLHHARWYTAIIRV